MNKHFISLPVLVASASALLVFSLTLPEEEPLIGESPTVSPTALQSPTPGSSPGKTVPPKRVPTPPPTPKPSPSPTPTASELPSFGIAATTPEEVIQEAQIKSGRIDPFIPLVPPDIPEVIANMSIEQLPREQTPTQMLNTLKQRQGFTGPGSPPPPPEPESGDGLEIKAIINGGTDPIAIIEVDGTSQLLHVGDYIRGDIMVTSIHSANRSVRLSRGGESATLSLESHNSFE